jgi:hypothetical protein
MTRHPLVTTLDVLDSLDRSEMVAGYMSAERGDPEPGMNHSLAYCHGWRSMMYDLREIETPPEHRRLTKEYVDRLNRRRSATGTWRMKDEVQEKTGCD